MKSANNAEVGRSLLRASILEHSSGQPVSAGKISTKPTIKFSITVVNLSEEIVDTMEFSASDKVAVIISKVEEALGGAQRVDLFVDGHKLLKDQAIEESGITDGQTVTALMKPKPASSKLSRNDAKTGAKKSRSKQCKDDTTSSSASAHEKTA